MRRLRHLATLALLVSSMLTMLAVASMAAPEHPEATSTEADHATEPVDAEHATDEAEHATDEGVQNDEGGASGDGHEEVAASDDDQWLGLKGAMAAGVLLGLLAFTMSGVAGLGEEAHH